MHGLAHVPSLALALTRVFLPSPSVWFTVGCSSLHGVLNDFGISFRFDYTYTYTLFFVGHAFPGCNRKWLDCTYTLEITLPLFNCFPKIQRITLTLTLLIVLNYKCNLAPPRVDFVCLCVYIRVHMKDKNIA